MHHACSTRIVHVRQRRAGGRRGAAAEALLLRRSRSCLRAPMAPLPGRARRPAAACALRRRRERAVLWRRGAAPKELVKLGLRLPRCLGDGASGSRWRSAASPCGEPEGRQQLSSPCVHPRRELGAAWSSRPASRARVRMRGRTGGRLLVAGAATRVCAGAWVRTRACARVCAQRAKACKAPCAKTAKWLRCNPLPLPRVILNGLQWHRLLDSCLERPLGVSVRANATRNI